ncbi:MAG TPA: RelA/SpoT family protein, partial [Gammaproteobacteria bacterium]|nr:RelA/SpoT family protein [Gammaproteobacteria bacterium]
MNEGFELLHQEVKGYLTDAEINAIEEAYLFAKKAHEGQVRFTGESYITHPIAVARVLAQMRMDETTIMAAILHDVIEDTYVEKQEVAQRFGEDVANLVEGVTKLTQIHFESHAQAQAENFRKLIMAMTRDIRVILVKLADRLHNMRTLDSLPPPKRRRIASETLEIFAPIANRLGMHAMRVELEDLGFRTLYPLRYRILKESVEKARGNRREIMDMIEQEIRKTLKKGNIPSWVLAGREKHLYSIYKKMHDRHLSFSEIMDVYGFRVVVDKIDTCYRVLGGLHNLFKPIPQRFKDYIAIPKANGYQSLHTTLFGPYGVPLEVQVRTEEMHRLAENGIAAHWLYKTQKKSFDEAQSRAKEWLDSVLEMEKSARNPLEFIENVKIDLFPDEVYVFTPRGNIIELPAGATAVDFAYAIHSDIGNTCVAAKLDKHLAPLSTPLKSGQQVEIITAPGARPNPAWLNFVVTGKAKSGIKHFLKRQQREESIDLGKRLVSKALLSLGGTLESVTEENLQSVAKVLKLDAANHLFEEVGLGNRAALLVARQLAKTGGILKEAAAAAPAPTPMKPLAIKGTEGIVVNYAKCCRPIPGDTIGGFLKPGEGVEIHEAHCAFLENYRQFPERYVSLRWEESVSGDFPVDIDVETLNQRGALAALATTISAADSNIFQIHAEDCDGRYFMVKLTITVKSRTHLARILR